MPDKIRVNEDRGIIEVQSYGVVTKEDIAESINKIQQIGKTKGIKKILVDTTKQETMPSTVDVFEIFSNFPRGFRLATLIQRSQATAEVLRFVETVGVNRAFPVKIFYEKDQALQWLDNG